MAKTFETEIRVRGYELDGYGHVNHAVYISYMDHGRWTAMREHGIDLAYFQSNEAWPVVADLEAKYLKPCFVNDELMIRTTCTSHGRVAVDVVHEIFRKGELVVRGKILLVAVNAKGRPTALPPAMKLAMTGEA